MAGAAGVAGRRYYLVGIDLLGLFVGVGVGELADVVVAVELAAAVAGIGAQVGFISSLVAGFVWRLRFHLFR